MHENNNHRITVWLFLAFITGFSIYNHLLPQQAFSETENRSLAVFPKFTIREVVNGRWMKAFEESASDQFPFRDSFMRIKTKADLAVGKSDNGKVYFGRDGYLIGMERPNLKQQTANRILLCSFLERIEKEIESPIPVSVLLVPSAGTVEKKKLPEFTPPFEEASEMEALTREIEKVSKKTLVVNAIKPLTTAKENGIQIYYRNDHHWTTFGAYEVYRDWAAKNKIAPLDRSAFQVRLVSNSFYGTNQAKALGAEQAADEIYSWSLKENPDYLVEVPSEKRITHSIYEDAFLRKKDKYAYFLGRNTGELRIHTPVKNGKNLMVIKDSYANSFVPFLCGHYESITVIDPRYYRGKIYDTIQENKVTEILFLYSFLQFSNDRNFVYGVR